MNNTGNNTMIRPVSHRITNPRESGAALLAALITLAVLTTIAASVFLSSVPAYRGTYQAAAWHEAKLAADAGIDFGLSTLQKTCPNPMAYDWAGWTTDTGTPVPPNYDGIRIYTPPANTLVNGGDGSTQPRITRVEIDVITRDDNFMQNAWFRVRSTGMAEVPNSQLSLDKRDLTLRRIALKQNHVTRTFEVLSRPVYLWEYALKTDGSMALGGGSTWVIDSYDSRYWLYPERSSPLYPGIYDGSIARAFGNVASNLQRPANSPYGMLIDAAGAAVRGEVQTHGGDDPNTETHENVEESQNIDPTRITDEYSEVLTPEPTPAWASSRTADAIVSGTQAQINPGTRGTTATDPYRIIIDSKGNKALGGFEVVNPTPGTDRFVDIYVNGDINLGGSTILVQKGVHVNLYLAGDMDFKNQDINYVNPEKDPARSALYSNRPVDLLIYGLKSPTATPAPRVDSSGNGHIDAAFYGPQYAGNLDGNTEIIGSFVIKSYAISGGGGSGGDSLGAGFHYDEALGVVGPVKYYKSVSYFEDTRKDVQ